MRIVFAISRAASVDETWTTVHLARIALSRGHQIRFVEPWDFEIDASGHPPDSVGAGGRPPDSVGAGGRLIARAHAFDSPATAEQIAVQLVSRRAVRRYVDLERIDLMLLRAAPLDMAVLTFATLAKERGVRIVNDPAGVTAVSHKAWLAGLPDVRTPRSIVTRSRASCHVFYQGQGDGVVVKPARGSGGRGVSFVPPRDRSPTFGGAGDGAALDLAFELARDGGDGYVVAQQYLPEAEHGETRLVWLDGAVIGGYLRRRAPGEFRHNLKRGGQAEPTAITAADLALGEQIAPHLLRAGVRLAGLDVIGDHLIEVNALNPGGAFHADRLTGSRLGERIVDRLTTCCPPDSVGAGSWPPDSAIAGLGSAESLPIAGLGSAESLDEENTPPWAIPAP